MMTAYDIWLKLYYRAAPVLVKQGEVPVPPEMSDRINIFLYFDYEREFSGQPANVSDNDIRSILAVLSQEKLKTTWFTVGRIFGKYPDSIRAIHAGGHEIGSHTYSHISPLSVKKKRLAEDFTSFSRSSAGFDIKGFHSPMGQWSVSQLKMLAVNGFTYDLSGGKNSPKKPFVVSPGRPNEIYRLVTAGDDWPLYAAGKEGSDPFLFFKGEIEKLCPGDLAGFGFHPWILASRKDIMSGFTSLLKYLGGSSSFLIEPASYFVGILARHKSSL